MSNTSIIKKAYYKIAKLSLFYSLALTTIVVSTSFYHLKSKRLKDIKSDIHLTSTSLTDFLIEENFYLVLKSIQNKTLLQEIAIFSNNCERLASTSLSIPNLCRTTNTEYESLKVQINSTPVIFYFKPNYPFHIFFKENAVAFFSLFLIFSIFTSIIFYLFLRNSLLDPINRIKSDLGRSEETKFPVELDFIAHKLVDLKNEISSFEKDRVYFNLARQVVHDIRNPLAYLQIMSQNDHLDLKSFNKKIQEIDYHITKLLRPKTKTVARTSISLFFNELTADLQKLFGVQITLTGREDLDSINLAISSYELQNIFTNLAKNSSEANASTININLDIIDQHLQFTISDNGSGIDDETSKQLFHRNFTTKSDGNGIGLNSIKEFLEYHGGSFHHISSYKSGAQFILQIPFMPFNQSYVIIDDDKFIRKAWQMAAQRKDIKLYSYPSISDFLAASSIIPKDSPIYVDSDLGVEKGEFESAKIFNIGFKSIFLSTSFDDIKLSEFPWLSGIASKKPPF
ncbi:MAG: HAMP domain-containing histidine kinase [Bacteriovoracaceae bacterium]|nr:HAMP domain-containing histidine kinase [Bacteriovoracaceae bacterium]